MTKDKVQKQAVRARMARTGERYTTARHYHLDLHHEQPVENGVDETPAATTLAEAAVAEESVVNTLPVETEETPDAQPLPSRVAEPGVSDEAVRRATGKDWDEWFGLLDAWGGTTHNHAEIARYIYETYAIDGWWAQNVTVGYERARGMRALHERPDGFSMNASKTFPVPLARLFAAFVNEEERTEWLDGIALRTRTSQENKSARFDVLPGDARLAVYFTARGPDKASAQLQMERLPSAADVERWKALWKDQLARLASFLGDEPPRT